MMTNHNDSGNPQYVPTSADILAITDGANRSLANHLDMAARLAAAIKKLNETVSLKFMFPDEERQAEVTAAWESLCRLLESEAEVC
jgi:hypothetical protein